MLEQVQSRYGLKVPDRIAYWDGRRLATVSEALVQELPRKRRQLFIEYPGGLELWLNDHPTENWRIPSPIWYKGRQNRPAASPNPIPPGGDAEAAEPQGIELPPSGWAAFSKKGELCSFSALKGTNRIDYLRSPEYIYLDGRGH